MNNRYDNLYIDILKIGQNKVTEGLSFNTLRQELTCKKYDLDNDCIELATKQWFFDCFHHRDSDTEPVNYEQLNDHLDCNFILKGDYAIKIVEHETAKRNLQIAWAALIIAFLAFIISIIVSFV